jgi:hypothetical protein
VLLKSFAGAAAVAVVEAIVPEVKNPNFANTRPTLEIA